MGKGKLLRSDQRELAAQLRAAIGATGDEPVEVLTPDFDRPSDAFPVKNPPPLPSEWERLRGMTKRELMELGLLSWDRRLMLFPSEWYAFIPEGFVIVDIFGRKKVFHKGITSKDKREGCLAYGIFAMDGVEVPEKG